MSTLFVRRLRLGAAFVLLTYVCLHFVNHALGIVSLDAMAAGRWWFLALCRRASSAAARSRVAVRLSRRALLATLPGLVSAREALALRCRAAAAGSRVAGVRRGRPGGHRVGANTWLDRGDAARGARAQLGRG